MKYAGKIGFIRTYEERPGIYKTEEVLKPYIGNVTRFKSYWQSGDGVNDNININNEISIVADKYARDNFQYIKFIEFMGCLWNIKSIEVRHPRFIITIGDVYNGGQAE